MNSIFKPTDPPDAPGSHSGVASTDDDGLFIQSPASTTDDDGLFLSPSPATDSGDELWGDFQESFPCAETPAEPAEATPEDLVAECARLKETADYATKAAMAAMSNMSELGTLLESMRRMNTSESHHALALAVLSGMEQFGLNGTIQIRAPTGEITLCNKGVAPPIDAKVIAQMANMERIVQF